MKFDYLTIFASISLLDIAVALIMLIYVVVIKPKKWFIYTYSAQRIIEAIVLIGFGLRGKIPDYVSIYICNILYFGSHWLQVVSITSYRGKFNKNFSFIQGFIIIIFTSAFFLTINNVSLRIIIQAIGVFVVFAYTSLYLMQHRKPYKLPVLLAIGCFIYAVINLSRALDIYFYHFENYDITKLYSIEILHISYAFVMIVVTTLGFLLLLHEVDEKTISDNNELIINTNKKLRKSEESLKEAQQVGNVGHWEYNISQDKLYWSEQTYRIYEVANNSFETNFENVIQLCHPDDKQMLIDTYHKSVANKTNLVISHRIVTSTEKTKFIIQRAITKYDNSGNPLSTLGTVQDVTELKKIEISNTARIELNEYSFTRPLPEILQKTLDLICEITDSKIGFYHFVDDDHDKMSFQGWFTKTIIYSRPLISEQCKYSLERASTLAECIRSKRPIIHNDCLEFNNASGLPSGAGSVLRELVVPILRNDKVVAVLGVGNKTELYDQTDIEFVNFFADLAWTISERKRAEVQIGAQNKELLELNATKDKFISILAHDLKSPFNALLGFTEGLQDLVKEEKLVSVKYFVDIIEQISKNTYKLLENLLDWARSQQNIISFNPEKINLYEVVNECMSFVNSNALAKNIELKTEVFQNIFVLVDANMINTILRNLLTNAIKFTPISGKITLNTNIHESIVEITVSDTGVGMSDKTKNSLFKIGESRSMDGTEGEHGTGFGLLLCKEFVEKHGGEIWVESEVGNGSNFKFTMPLCDE